MTSDRSQTDSIPGAYVLVISVPEGFETSVGALGTIAFRAGGYAYVGSAMNGLRQRIERHLDDEKKRHWHIDYLLERAEVADVVRIPSEDRLECDVARKLSRLAASVPDFGSSDCDCASHLFYAPDSVQLREMVDRAIAAVKG